MVPSSLLKLCLVGIAALLLASGGCQSGGAAPAASSRALLAGPTTFVYVPGGQGAGQVVAYSAPGTKVCPECEATAEKYFATGELDHHVCKVCGATLSAGQGTIYAH